MPNGELFLPRHDFVNNSLLFQAAPPKIDARCLDALVPHQVGQESDVVVLLQKVLRKAMTEGMRIHDLLIKPILLGIILQLLRNAPGRDSLSKTIQKEISGVAAGFLDPRL